MDKYLAKLIMEWILEFQTQEHRQKLLPCTLEILYTLHRIDLLSKHHDFWDNLEKWSSTKDERKHLGRSITYSGILMVSYEHYYDS